jgi:hypothetical protein
MEDYYNKYAKYKIKYLSLKHKNLSGGSETKYIKLNTSNKWYFDNAEYDAEAIKEINDAINDLNEGRINDLKTEKFNNKLDDKNRLDLLYFIRDKNETVVHIIDFTKMEILDMSTLETYQLRK